MIIQNIIFPSNDFNPTLNAFIRVKGESNLQPDINELVLKTKTRADFNTYFNGFSIEKWRKYTDIGNIKLHLEIKGSFRVILYNEYREHNNNFKQKINSYVLSNTANYNYSEVSSSENICAENIFSNDQSNSQTTFASYDLPIPDSFERGIISFSLICLENNSTFKNGYFFTDQKIDEFNKACFAIDICTYKREKYVRRNIDLLNETIFREDSPLKDAFEVFISDNSKSLDLENLNDKVHIFPNKNTGGAGGFGRCMIEILQSPNYNNFTHVIMMDDDIKFSYETLYRTYIMASTLKKEYHNAFIGGAMLKLNDPKIQSEALDVWSKSKHNPVKYNYNITELKYVLKNEIEDKANYLGWWYCTMPIGVIKANNLPLPIFIKRDDIEYGIRNGRTFITLNGICVLHEAFDLKRQGYLDYYYWRNQCILNAIHYPQYSKEALKKQMFGVFKHCIMRYRYNDANLAFVGVEDFLKGVDWLKTTDAEDLNSYIMNYSYKATDISGLPINFIHGQYERALLAEESIRAEVTPKHKSLLNKKLVLGLFLKASGLRYVKMNNPEAYLFYRKKTIINYDELTNKAFVTKKSLKQTYSVYRNYKRLCKLIDEKYDNVKNEYKYRQKELIKIQFWNSYLGLDGTQFESRDYSKESIILTENAILENKRKATLLKKDTKFLNKVRIARLIQHLFLFWLPIKRNRISFYLYERKGYNCNIKYIIDELQRKYGNKCEIIFITRHSDAFSELVKRDIKVVKLNSFKHWYYQFTSKVVVANDSYPEPVVLRKFQYKINTWHASMNYKKIGPAYVNFRNDVTKQLFYIRNKQPNLYLSGSQFFTDDTSASFAFDKNVFQPTGSPRNDIFFRNNEKLDASIRYRYALEKSCKLALFAPTFRDGFKEQLNGIDFEKLLISLKTRFGGDWKILYRKHYFINSNEVILDKYIIDVSDYDDMNELLAISDVLISDYSSCLWDFALTKRPSFVFAPDIKEYSEKDRSFAYPLEKWPYSIALDNDELSNNIVNFDNDSFVKKINEHLIDGNTFDDGHASERVVKIIAQKMGLEEQQ